jgi:hypothetical protein
MKRSTVNGQCWCCASKDGKFVELWSHHYDQQQMNRV